MTASYPGQLASGLNAQTAFEPFDLFAGDLPVTTDHEVVGAVDLEQFRVVARDEGGALVKWDPTAGNASAVLNFTGVGTAADTITINGQAITLVASGATGFQANIGGSATFTAQAVKAVINANPDTFKVVASGAAASLTLTSLEPGEGGNSIAVAEAGTNTNFTGSVTALAGGADTTVYKPVGIMAQATVAGATGPFYKGGFFNHAALVWPASITTLAQRRAAFDRTPIGIGAPK